VFDGEGVATRKYDGTCVLIENGVYFKRRTVKAGKAPPAGFEELECDPTTGNRVGWIAVDPRAPENKYHVEAYNYDLALERIRGRTTLWDGTYELCGTNIRRNPENIDGVNSLGQICHRLVRHCESTRYADVPRTYEGLRYWLYGKDIEGIVFHHADGRMGKIKLKDYGFNRSKDAKTRDFRG
jgi:hypothetical protein